MAVKLALHRRAFAKIASNSLSTYARTKGDLIGATIGFLLLQIAGAAAQDVCSGILRYAGRDEIQEDQDLAIAQSIYRQHCQGSASRSSSSESAGVGAIVSSIPVSFNIGGASTSEQLNNFCKTANSQNILSKKTNLRRSIVVREALNTFEDCIKFANRDIFFEPVIDRTRLVIGIRRGAENAEVLGIHYNSEELSCTVPNAEGTNSTTPATPDTRKILNTISYLISCNRAAKPEQDGALEYPRAEIVIATDRGNFLLAIASDELRPERWASEVSGRISDLDQHLSALDKKLQSTVFTNDNMNCVRYYNTQLCWGEVTIEPGRSVTGSWIHPFSATFPAVFTLPPTVNHSILVNETSPGSAYSVYRYDITNTGWTGTLRLIAGGGAAPPKELRLFYTAFGVWKGKEE